MIRRYDVITFDCYGTLIDWNRGIRAAFQSAARAEGLDVASEQVLPIYHEVEPQVQATSFRLYREVLAEVAQRIAQRLGWAMDDAAAQRFAASLPAWPPFSDTDAALNRLVSAGYRLGILSNVDGDLLQGTLQHFSAPIELIVTAQQVRSYKPAHGHFLEARKRIGDQRWLHAAQSLFHDVRPCNELNIPVVWVNRENETLPPNGPRPLDTVPSLAALAGWLDAADA
ncbi:MAG TPA: HAD-IA family hydrolase [Roseiflexaceae bacterium]|nr:HAD-IA family hydrolase [Roseiflexaceae bacterium]